jgi:caffeoyl-CoA O-methyltransferase
VSGLVDPDIERYAAAHTTAQPAALDALARRTVSELGHEEMLSGPVVGRLLELLVHAIQPRLVVEVGTFSGYSAIAMAAGLPPGGRIITCELDDDHAALAREAIAASPYADRIELRPGDARETLRALDEPVDFAFVDADKPGYPGYVRLLLERLSPHGLIAADNTLYYGEVLAGEGAESENGRALHAFNESLVGDAGLVVAQLTMRDGVTLIRRR